MSINMEKDLAGYCVCFSSKILEDDSTRDLHPLPPPPRTQLTHTHTLHICE